MTCLGPCPSVKWEWKVTCPPGKSTRPWRLDSTFFKPRESKLFLTTKMVIATLSECIWVHIIAHQFRMRLVQFDGILLWATYLRMDGTKQIYNLLQRIAKANSCSHICETFTKGRTCCGFIPSPEFMCSAPVENCGLRQLIWDKIFTKLELIVIITFIVFIT